MSKPKFFQYPSCSTCKKAQKFLADAGIEVEAIHIVDSPPSEKELSLAASKLISGSERLSDGLRKMFNSSGEMYRTLALKDKIATLSESEMLKLLAANGKLIKRPLFIAEDCTFSGFKEQDWRDGTKGLR